MLSVNLFKFRVGNTYLRSDVADLGVDSKFGAYYRFALVAITDIPAGVELVADYRLAPWFIAQAPRRWKCPGVERTDDVCSDHPRICWLNGFMFVKHPSVHIAHLHLLKDCGSWDAGLGVSLGCL